MPHTLAGPTTAQPDFFEDTPSGYLRVSIHDQQTATPDDVARMVAHLRRNGWQTAIEVAQALDLGYGEAGKRKARAIAAQSKGQIISGQSGYAATQTATRDEINHATAWLRSQAAEMLARADEIERVANV